MSVTIVKRKVHATLASKIAGKKQRQRQYRRDLRGQFSLSDQTLKSHEGLSSAGKQATRKVRPKALLRVTSSAQKRKRMVRN